MLTATALGKTMYKDGRGTGARDTSSQRWVGFPHPGLSGGAAGYGLRRSRHELRRTDRHAFQSVGSKKGCKTITSGFWCFRSSGLTA
jgi:hypothetical protein